MGTDTDQRAFLRLIGNIPVNVSDFSDQNKVTFNSRRDKLSVLDVSRTVRD